MEIDDVDVGHRPGKTCRMQSIFVGDNQVVDDCECKCEVTNKLLEGVIERNSVIIYKVGWGEGANGDCHFKGNSGELPDCRLV